MKRRCLIHAISPITCFTVPIIGRTELNLTDDEIYKCLCSKAEIKEILPNGEMINLDFSNYNKSVVEEEPLFIEETIVIEEEPLFIEETIVVEEEITIETEENNTEIIIEDSPVKTHEVPSRNKQPYKKNKKNKR